MSYTFNPRTREKEAAGFKSSRPVLVYRASLRTSRATQRNTVRKNQDKKKKKQKERDRKRRSHSTAQFEATPSLPDSTRRLEARLNDGEPLVPPWSTRPGHAAGGRLGNGRALTRARNPGSERHAARAAGPLLQLGPMPLCPAPAPPPRKCRQAPSLSDWPSLQRAGLAARRGCVLPAAGLTCRSRCWGGWGCGGGGQRASGRGATRPSAADRRRDSGSRPVPPWRWRRSSRRSTRLGTGWLFTRCGAGGP